MNPQDNDFPEMDANAYEYAARSIVEKNIEEFEKTVRTKLVISLIGDANAGKSATINALTGRKLSSVSPISGWTKEITLHQYAEDVFIADTPGLHDTQTAEVAANAKKFVQDDADIILFFVNAASGRTPAEAEAFKAILRLGKPIIVVLNKVDTIALEDVPGVIRDLRVRFGYHLIVGISATQDINIKTLAREIEKILQEKGKDLLFLKIVKDKDEKVKIWITGAAITAVGLGALPIPGSDIVPLTALQVGLCLKIAYIYNCKVTKGDVMNLISSTVTGAVGKSLFRQAIKLMGGFLATVTAGMSAVITSAVAAGIAGAMTYGLGWAANAYYKSGMTMDLGEVGDIYTQAFNSYMNEEKSRRKAE